MAGRRRSLWRPVRRLGCLRVREGSLGGVGGGAWRRLVGGGAGGRGIGGGGGTLGVGGGATGVGGGASRVAGRG